MIRIPNPVATPCPDCGEPTVLAEYATGLHRVHCGTYRYTCTPLRQSSGAVGRSAPLVDS